jgi:hypothetical protein
VIVCEVVVDVNVATKPPICSEAIKVPVVALPRFVAVENVNVPPPDVSTVYGPANDPASVKTTDAPTGIIVWE